MATRLAAISWPRPRAARARGVRLDTRVFAARADDEVLVRELALTGTGSGNGASGVRLGAPFQVTAEVYASREVAATLTLVPGPDHQSLWP